MNTQADVKTIAEFGDTTLVSVPPEDLMLFYAEIDDSRIQWTGFYNGRHILSIRNEIEEYATI